MGLFSDAFAALKDVLLLQSNLERLAKSVDRQDGDIAGLREAIWHLRERIVRIETIIGNAPHPPPSRRALPKD